MLLEDLEACEYTELKHWHPMKGRPKSWVKLDDGRIVTVCLDYTRWMLSCEGMKTTRIDGDLWQLDRCLQRANNGLEFNP